MNLVGNSKFQNSNFYRAIHGEPKRESSGGGINTNKHYCTCNQSLELDFSPDAAASQKIEFC